MDKSERYDSDWRMIENLFRSYYSMLRSYAFRLVNDFCLAEDIVQDLFATMWEKKMRFLSLPSFRTYLYNSIRNASLNYLKHQNVESLYLERLASTYREITEGNLSHSLR